MNTIPFSLEQKIHQVITEKLSLKDFEQWLYQEDDLERVNPDLYFELISFDYSRESSLDAFPLSFAQYVDRYNFEVERIKDYLYSIINRDENCADSILMTYELYCMGYEFFQKLGLMYGLCLIGSSDPVRAINHLGLSYPVTLIENYNQIVDMFYPNIIDDAKNVLDWLEERKIIINNKPNGIGGFEYDDLRNEDEKIKGYVITTEI